MGEERRVTFWEILYYREGVSWLRVSHLAVIRNAQHRDRKLFAVTEIKSDPSLRNNLPWGTFNSMWSDFNVAPDKVNALYLHSQVVFKP